MLRELELGGVIVGILELGIRILLDLIQIPGLGNF